MTKSRQQEAVNKKKKGKNNATPSHESLHPNKPDHLESDEAKGVVSEKGVRVKDQADGYPVFRGI